MPCEERAGGPGRHDKQWGWAERVEGVVHLLIHENAGTMPNRGLIAMQGRILCPSSEPWRCRCPRFCGDKKKRQWAWGY